MSDKTQVDDFILASASPRRQELLARVGLAFSVIPPDVDESYIEGESPEEHVIRLAKDKAKKVSGEHPKKWVLAADTIVVLDKDILVKPVDKAQAKEMLGRLSGRTHEVYTGYCVTKHDCNKTAQGFVVSQVKIKELSEGEIEFYTNSDEPYDKAGGYAVQGIGAFMVEEIFGSYTNVVGLPLSQVISLMETLDAIRLY